VICPNITDVLVGNYIYHCSKSSNKIISIYATSISKEDLPT